MNCSMANILDRALELASSGQFTKIENIERALSREGYTRAYEHLSGSMIRRALRSRMREAQVSQIETAAIPAAAASRERGA